MEQRVAFNPRALAAFCTDCSLYGRFNFEFFRRVLSLSGETRARMRLHEGRKDTFRPAATNQQGSSPFLHGQLKIRKALQEKSRAERPRLHVAPTVLGPKPIVQHHHRHGFVAAQGFGQGWVVVQAEVVPKPVEGA